MVFIVGVVVLMVIHVIIACGAIVGVVLLTVIYVIIACGAIVGVVLLILVLIVVTFLFAIHVSHKWKYMYGSGGSGMVELGNLHFELTL